jgi:hypothetical protein
MAMKGTSNGNSSSSGQRFSIEERELRVGMAAAANGEVIGTFYGVEEGTEVVASG